MDFDSGIADRADGEGQGQALQQWEVDVHVEGLGLEAGKTIGDDLESGAHEVEMIEAFLETKVAQIIGAKLIAQEARELFVLFEKGVFPVGAKDVMAMLDLIEDAGQLSPQPFIQPDAEDLTDAVGGEAPQANLAATLEDLGNGKVAFKDEVATVMCPRMLCAVDLRM